MKLLLIILFLTGCVASREYPQADVVYFTVINCEVQERYNERPEYVYTVYDERNKVTYQVFDKVKEFFIGQRIYGVIRK